jgi:hypothetical protein
VNPASIGGLGLRKLALPLPRHHPDAGLGIESGARDKRVEVHEVERLSQHLVTAQVIRRSFADAVTYRDHRRSIDVYRGEGTNRRDGERLSIEALTSLRAGADRFWSGWRSTQ